MGTKKSKARWLLASLALNCFLILGIVGLILAKGGLSLPSTKPIHRDAPRFSETRLYKGRMDTWAAMPALRGAWVFVGDSLTDYAPLDELFGMHVLNRGIAGDHVADARARLAEVARHSPTGVVVWVGINDLMSGAPCETVAQEIDGLAQALHAQAPEARVVVVGLLPTAPTANKVPPHINETVRCVNGRLESAFAQSIFRFLNPGTRFSDANGDLDSTLSADGIHLNGVGYRAWAAWLNESVDWRPVEQ